MTKKDITDALDSYRDEDLVFFVEIFSKEFKERTGLGSDLLKKVSIPVDEFRLLRKSAFKLSDERKSVCLYITDKHNYDLHVERKRQNFVDAIEANTVYNSVKCGCGCGFMFWEDEFREIFGFTDEDMVAVRNIHENSSVNCCLKDRVYEMAGIK